jgi:hypothetical protein
MVQDRDLLFGGVIELHAFETARAQVEARYLAGMTADFPAVTHTWKAPRSFNVG